VIIHRSSFYHPINAILKFKRPSDMNPEELEKWRAVYRLADDKLIDFMGYVGSHVSQTKFLVYSRGTDPDWPNPAYRENWKKNVERSYPDLENRIIPMVIPGGFDGSFRKLDTRAVLRSNVIDILKLPKKRDLEKRN